MRPFAVKFDKPVAPRKGKMITALLWGDTHFPSQDDSAIAVVFGVLKRLQPTVMVHMGDLCDAYSLSRFDKDPARKESLQDEINMARAHLAQARKISPNSRMIFLEGNHENRMQRAMWQMDGPAAQLGKLTAFQKAITWPKLLDLESLHCEFYQYGEQSKKHLLPKFILKHGSLVRSKSAYTAAGEHEKYGKSGASGHTHRLGVFYRRDANGSHVWVETGTTARLDPEYVVDPNWEQGCVVLTFEPTTGAVSVEPIYIHEGMGVWRGEVYRA